MDEAAQKGQELKGSAESYAEEGKEKADRLAKDAKNVAEQGAGKAKLAAKDAERGAEQTFEKAKDYAKDTENKAAGENSLTTVHKFAIFGNNDSECRHTFWSGVWDLAGWMFPLARDRIQRG